MKTIIISALITLSISSSILIAQNDNKSGLYLKAKDYTKGNLSYKIDCKTEKHTIKLHEFFNGSNIDIIHNGQKYTYKKDSIWGFRTCENNEYRLLNKVIYKIVEAKKLIIYTTITIDINDVVDEKGQSEVAEYFFSKTVSGEIIPLTIMNLKRQFPTNTKFLDVIDMNFKYDDDLILFDDIHKMLRINHLAGEMIK